MEDTYHCEKSIKKNPDGLAGIYVVDVYDEFIGSRFPSIVSTSRLRLILNHRT